MFKKHVDVKALQRLSGADKKKLRRTAKERFPQASDADLDAILPPKVEITVAKYPNRALVYGIEGECPVIFDIDGRGHELFPTVYALWKVPHLLPAFMLKGGEVSRYVIGGADLMFPGISIPPDGLPSFEAGQPWSVKVPGNPAPIAVGTTTMSSTEALKAGLRGKALRIAHYYRDMLWQSPDSSDEHAEGMHDGGVISAENATVDVSDSHAADPGVHSEAVEEITDGVHELELPEGKPTEQQPEEKVHQNLTTEEVDSLLDKCLLQALYTTIKEKDLPLPGSTLWSNHILPCRPPGVTLDIKKSSHKKLSKWLQSKASSGLITAKEDKYKKEVMLTGINCKHPDYMAFRPEKRVQEPVEQATDMEKYYSGSEASDVVFRYVEKENLVKPTDKSKVILDVTLCDALYKGAIKKGSAYPTEIHKKDLGSTFLNRMQVHHRVSRGNEVVVRKGAIRTLQIMTERRQGNKKMTRLSGVESFLMDPDSLASELQKKFACSTTTAELPGKKGQYEVLVQGGVIDDLAKHLVEHYGVPKRFIEVLDKTKR
ncbi:hypothetical protein PR202_ga01702 [Eleusine coracana subsp. coracana]|uniref:SUI1 domain-containing protein n=1 Tax=Eleusine coracana subsp. coracana TaxID=191504 RepID=A0AAV5BJQ9_ELECO|nr:hypothetical protein PR202_ga01015 [Eleusine coracana subsp. coracana]GJM85895.1 hypothetical protein PR202_ga01702 [Eleusine coracana subsp. coracana]